MIGFYDSAAYWYALAAEQGYASSQYNLGSMYTTGHGVPQDHKIALKWYRLSAEQGHAGAQKEVERLEKKMGKSNGSFQSPHSLP